MLSITKEQMILYMKHYANLSSAIYTRGNMSMFDVICNIDNCFNRNEKNPFIYFDNVRNFYSIYLMFRLFSIKEDFLLNRDDFINNNDLDGLFDGVTFYTDISGLTNKRIIQIIRNAFNHNDSVDFERFKISPNLRFIEIEMRDVRTPKEIRSGGVPKPFKMKISVNKFIEVFNVFMKNARNVMLLGFDYPKDFELTNTGIDSLVDSVQIKRYYFTKKMGVEDVEKFGFTTFFEPEDHDELLKKDEELTTFADNFSEPVYFDLDFMQKDKLKEMLKGYVENHPPFIDLDKDKTQILGYFYNRVVPIPSYKQNMLLNQFYISTILLGDYNKSFKNVALDIAQSIVLSDMYPNGYFNNVLDSLSLTLKMHLFHDFMDEEFMVYFPIMMYVDSVISHFYLEDEIIIDGVVYNRNLIRNCFVHARWYIGTDGDVIMYDADPRNINDYKLNYIGKINIMSFKRWADDFVDSKTVRRLK